MPPDPKNPAGRKADNAPVEGEIYLEFHVIGQVVKVSAVDAKTGIEVSISGPITANRKTLERAVINKLNYVMNKR